jgi:S1-C subfamily serine protease
VVLRLSDASRRSWPSAAPRADEEAGRVGSLVLAVGRPGREVSVSFGIVSAVAEGWRSLHGTRIDRVLRLDLSVYDGFSGGPLVAASGGVIGIDTSTFARGAPTALPAAEVDRVLEQILKRGHVRRPFIGVAVHPVELGPSMVREHKLERSTGLVVLSLAEGAPADAAGVLIGDVLLEASGRAIARPADLLDVLSATGEGDTLDLSLLRGGSVKKVLVTPIDRSSHREGPAE